MLISFLCVCARSKFLYFRFSVSVSGFPPVYLCVCFLSFCFFSMSIRSLVTPSRGSAFFCCCSPQNTHKTRREKKTDKQHTKMRCNLSGARDRQGPGGHAGRQTQGRQKGNRQDRRQAWASHLRRSFKKKKTITREFMA